MRALSKLALLGLVLAAAGCGGHPDASDPDYYEIAHTEHVEITGMQTNPFPIPDDGEGESSPPPPADPWDPFPTPPGGDSGGGGGDGGPHFPSPDFPEETDGPGSGGTTPTDPWNPGTGGGFGGGGFGGGWGGGGFGGYGTIPGIQEMVSVGNLVYTLVEQNQPKVSSDTNRISILPNSPEEWENLEGWTGPHVRTFILKSKNRMGGTVLTFQYKIIYYANGNLDGKGKYIANLQVVPEVVDVGWGFKFDSRFEVADIINAGTKASPVVGAHFQLQWRLHSLMKRTQGVDPYYLKGDSDLLVIR